MTHPAKFLIVGFDGFRPELMSPDLTPNLWNLARGGSFFRNHRCCFPSETFANLPSLVYFGTAIPITLSTRLALALMKPSWALPMLMRASVKF